MQQRLPLVCSVDLRRFQHVLRNAHKAGDVNQQHIAAQLPRLHDHHGGKRRSRRGQPGFLQQRNRQHAVQAREHPAENNLPDITEDQAADQVGRKESRPEEVLSLHTAGQQVRQQEGKQVDEYNGQQGEPGCQSQGIPERAVLEGCRIVVEADEILHVRQSVPVRERQVNTVDQRNDNHADEEEYGGPGKCQEQVKSFPE